ncbi:MAG: O-antigen ligase [Caulobacteraceae bacterium]|nr:O-antigen ligase [Caulobacteraceae bacterium]
MTFQAGAWPRPQAQSAEPAKARRGEPGLVYGYALSLIILLMFTQPWVVVQFQQTQADSLLARALFFPAYVAGLLLLFQRPGRAVIGLLREPFIVVMLAVAAASLFWSVAPDQTSRRIVAIGLSTLAGVALGSRWRWSQLVEICAVAFAVMAILSLILALAAPSVGRMTELFPGAWRGLWIEKNTFGGLMAFASLNFAAAALFQPRRSLFWWGMTALAIVMLGLSTSKTSLVSLMLGGSALAFVLLVRRGGATAVAATWLAVVGLTALVAIIALNPDLFLGLLGKDATLTGRTKIWAAVWRLIQQRPILGYGYGAVWSDDTGWGPLQWVVKQAGFKPQHAHNSWLEQWLGLGIVGLGAWTLFYVSTLAKTIWAVFTNRGALLVFPFLVVYSMTTLTESVALVYNDMRWVLLVAYAIRLSIPSRGEAP